MMQLTTIASSLILFYGLFGTITATTDTNNDHDAVNILYFTSKINIKIFTFLISDWSTSCILGVKHVSIALYTRDIPNGQFVQVNESCNFLNSSTSIFFITHGFIANHSNYNLSVVASQLLKKQYAVFSLDWSDAACYNDPAVVNLLEYPFAVRNTREVGNYLANYIKSICDTCSVPFKNIALVGHSLGAHISSFAAKNLQTSGYGKVPLLIGSDPAGPLFMLNGPEDRFSDTDAERVIALHTSALGLQKSLGHLDLWFNNGKQYAVFSLDWSDAACYNDPAVLNLLEYPFAVRNTREVGNYWASVSFKNIALIGHSLGAHISSIAAKNLQTSGYGKVPLLIGCDPAGPLFMLNGPENRFSDTDAKRVIALHTSALGLQKSLGHLDLWFNN
ncbi:PA1 Phospholipase, partial [Pseudoatta argentina]